MEVPTATKDEGEAHEEYLGFVAGSGSWPSLFWNLIFCVNDFKESSRHGNMVWSVHVVHRGITPITPLFE